MSPEFTTAVPAVTAAERRAVGHVVVEDVGPRCCKRRNCTGAASRADGLIVVLAGSSSNESGGLRTARHLLNRDVRVVLDREPGDPDLVVDALVGYGLPGPLWGGWPTSSAISTTSASNRPSLPGRRCPRVAEDQLARGWRGRPRGHQPPTGHSRTRRRREDVQPFGDGWRVRLTAMER